MTIWRLTAVLFLFCCALYASDKVMSGPDDRVPTDPRSVVSTGNPVARPAPFDDLFYTRNVFGAAWSPDGLQIVFTTDMSGRFNLWKVRSSGGWPIQLTQSDDRQYSAVWSPDGKWIVYEQDQAGNELWDLFAIPSDGGTPVNLTNTPEIREEDPHWSNDGRTIAFSRKPKEGTQYDIALLDWSTHQIRTLTHEQQPGYSWTVVGWANHDKTIIADCVNPPFTDADVYAIDVSSGKIENLTSHQGTVRYLASSVCPDSRTILLSCDANGGFMNVALLGIASNVASSNEMWTALP